MTDRFEYLLIVLYVDIPVHCVCVLACLPLHLSGLLPMHGRLRCCTYIITVLPYTFICTLLT